MCNWCLELQPFLVSTNSKCCNILVILLFVFWLFFCIYIFITYRYTSFLHNCWYDLLWLIHNKSGINSKLKVKLMLLRSQQWSNYVNNCKKCCVLITRYNLDVNTSMYNTQLYHAQLRFIRQNWVRSSTLPSLIKMYVMYIELNRPYCSFCNLKFISYTCLVPANN